MDQIEKENIIKLRLEGWSYNQLTEKSGVPKSTLSYWFKDLRKSNDITAKNISSAKTVWAKNITAYNKKRSKDAAIKRGETQALAKKEINKISPKELLLIGTALYWAEGFKRTSWYVIFSNSDPAMIALMMQFFRNICQIPDQKILGQVQLHKNISEESATNYWSVISKIPKDQFLKSISQQSTASKSKRKNNLPYGVFRIRVNNVNQINKIKGWIQGVAGQYLRPPLEENAIIKSHAEELREG